jgi:hypothetical protein
MVKNELARVTSISEVEEEHHSRAYADVLPEHIPSSHTQLMGMLDSLDDHKTLGARYSYI